MPTLSQPFYSPPPPLPALLQTKHRWSLSILLDGFSLLMRAECLPERHS